jgi:glycosyltransferase involved in cell wall biosynthesis
MSRQFAVGLDSRYLARWITGISNYTFHIVRSVLERKLDLQFIACRDFDWQVLDLAGLERTSAAHQSTAAGQTLLSLKAAKRRIAEGSLKALWRLPAARVIYRQVSHRQIARSGRSQSLDLFHAFNFRPPVDLGVPVLPVIYDLSTFRHPEFHPVDRVRWLAPVEGLVADAPIVHTISEFSKREIMNVFGLSGEKIFVAPPAAAELYAPMGEEATQRDLAPLGLAYGNFFLTVGTLEPRKNIRTLISAYARLPAAARAQCPLVVAGGKGWGDLKLPRQVDALRSEGALRFLAGISNPQLRSLYEGARLLLMPSLYEGFGMPVVEALACGTPVAYSSRSAMEDVAAGLGRAAPAEDVDAWSEILRHALACSEHLDPILRGLRIERARTFDWSQSASQVIDAYRRLSPGSLAC